MVQRKSTPEEQLLKLIENPAAQGKSGAAGSASGKKAAAKRPALRLPGIGKLGGFLSYLKTRLEKKQPIESGGHGRNFQFDIKLLNRCLVGAVLAVGIYFILDIFLFKPGQADFLSQVSTSEPVFSVIGDASKSAPKEITFYKQTSDRRNPFFPPSAQPVVEQGQTSTLPAVAAPTGKIGQILQGLKLVGVSLGGSEPIAMVEDAATTRTYFLKQGQEIHGVKVQSISREKITVTYEGEEGTLF